MTDEAVPVPNSGFSCVCNGGAANAKGPEDGKIIFDHPDFDRYEMSNPEVSGFSYFEELSWFHSYLSVPRIYIAYYELRSGYSYLGSRVKTNWTLERTLKHAAGHGFAINEIINDELQTNTWQVASFKNSSYKNCLGFRLFFGPGWGGADDTYRQELGNRAIVGYYCDKPDIPISPAAVTSCIGIKRSFEPANCDPEKIVTSVTTEPTQASSSSESKTAASLPKMASLEDRDNLKRTGACPGCELNSLDLTLLDLSGASLSKASLRKTNLSGANLKKDSLREARLIQANLSVADLRGADLSQADLNRADLSGADFRRANLRGAGMWQADLRWADLAEADLSEANMRKADLRDDDLSNAKLSGANVEGAKFCNTTMPDGSKNNSGC